MYSPITTLVDRLDRLGLPQLGVIPWSSPVPFFGDLTTARVATVGINPSNREFVDDAGMELDGEERRLPTLRSLELTEWAEVQAFHLRQIIDACVDYFRINPYDRWFATLERVVARFSGTFYGDDPSACHLDLVPYATTEKWGLLPTPERKQLLAANADALGLLLRESSVELLILNGRSVVSHFEGLSGSDLVASPMPEWDLPRSAGRPVTGVAYSGETDIIGDIQLARVVRVVGYNHNLQSSYGVTGDVINAIADWIGRQEHEEIGT